MKRNITGVLILFCALWIVSALPDHAADGKLIRVGVIRCDFHGMFYAPLLGKHDPAKLQNPMRGMAGKNYYSWQGGGSHFAFYRNYGDRTQMTVPQVEGFEIVKLWDEHRDAAEMASAIFYSRPKVCDTFEEVSDDVDMVLIGDCNYDGSDHLKLASPGLKKGVPTFLDKPFANTYGDAKKLVELSRERNAPLLSLSILRELPLARLFRDRFNEIKPVRFGVIRGGGPTLAGQIHTISLAQLLFGPGVRTVESMGQTPLAYIHLGYGGVEGKPDDGVMLLCASGKTSVDSQFFASAYSEAGGIHSPALNWYTFPYGAVEIVKLMKRMVLERKSPVPTEEMLELIAIVDAARMSQKEKRQVRLEEITGAPTAQ